MESSSRRAVRHDCENCWVRHLETFREFSPPELEFVSAFKSGQMQVEPGSTVLSEGSLSPHLYTVLSGWGFRYKILEDGRRQVLNYVSTGDLLGLQGTLMGEMQHSVEALSPLEVCIFERERLGDLFRDHPGLAFDLTWIAAREERILDEHLLSIGRRSAIERAAYLLAFLAHKARESGLAEGKLTNLPVTQSHVADTLGLSIVHTNKTLRKLAERGVIRWLERGCEVLNEVELARIADWRPPIPRRRPFI
ncbi:Crp/Fnr family transcriptional regulator [Rhizobium sp. SG_E_25_P2]|uniref:Crp/Fnr family transcriptional regulator n=1 Tax=Rhizobium sp. SG_E_25_P2 TaxID=2879942 RepID=UPI0024766664|nr:Crp/Fnr family transcriptional regulator [Rhizobium sp. SG_E_25_P2]